MSPDVAFTPPTLSLGGALANGIIFVFNQDGKEEPGGRFPEMN